MLAISPLFNAQNSNTSNQLAQKGGKSGDHENSESKLNEMSLHRVGMVREG